MKRCERLAMRLLSLSAVFAAVLAGCGRSGDGDGHLIETRVSAATGATLSVGAPQPALRLVIAPGALTADATVTVDALADPPAVGADQTAASAAYRVVVSGATLQEPMLLELRADPVPAHPQLGEIAQLKGDTWERLPANFLRPSDQMVLALTDEEDATFRVVHRTLRATSGDAAARGREVFLYETFGNENFFGPVVGLHTLLNGMAPIDAVALGVQVDLARVPSDVVAVMAGTDLAAKDAALADPAVTRLLLQAGAVVGVKAVFDTNGALTSAGITCALCHVNAEPTVFQLTSGPTALPVGNLRFDGVPNSQMNAGAILALTPFAQGAGQATVDLLNSWGPGRFDVRALPDNPLDDSVNNPTDNPPIWNFLDLEDQGYLFGWDGLFKNGPDRNALASQAEAVYDLVMHGNGAFGISVNGAFGVPGAGNLAPELRITPPQDLVDKLVAAEQAQPGNDIDTQQLLDVQEWMRSIVSPAPGAFDESKAEQGFMLFFGKGNCSSCHNTPDLTDAAGRLFTFALPAEAGDLGDGIHVPSLRGIARTAPYLHDGSLPTLKDVVDTLNTLGVPLSPLNAAEVEALVEYLNSL